MRRTRVAAEYYSRQQRKACIYNELYCKNLYQNAQFSLHILYEELLHVIFLLIKLPLFNDEVLRKETIYSQGLLLLVHTLIKMLVSLYLS